MPEDSMRSICSAVATATKRRCSLSLGIAGVLLIALLSSSFVPGQKKAPGAKAETSGAVNAKAADADTERFERLRQEGFEALYNLDYEGARRRFKELSTAFPSHPAGPQFLAATLWAQTLNESRRLQSSLYDSDAFFNASEDKPDPKIVSQFKELTREATVRAKARLKRNKSDTEALYFLGATEGLKAAFETAVERRFMAALGDGSSSVDRHREALRLDPEFHDAELTIGLYDYIVGGLPAMVKIVASVAGMRGSKKRGLLTLERVAREGRWARDDAKALLIVLYKRERRYADALAFARDLAARYADNYLFKIEAADALVSQAADQRRANETQAATTAEREAFAIFDGLLQRDSAQKKTAPRAPDLIHYRYGEALFTAGQTERAAVEFLAAANAPGAEQTLGTMSRLRAAQALDLAGRRDDALKQYRAVLERPDIYGAHEDAKSGLRQPFQKKNEEKRATG